MAEIVLSASLNECAFLYVLLMTHYLKRVHQPFILERECDRFARLKFNFE